MIDASLVRRHSPEGTRLHGRQVPAAHQTAASYKQSRSVPGRRHYRSNARLSAARRMTSARLCTTSQPLGDCGRVDTTKSNQATIQTRENMRMTRVSSTCSPRWRYMQVTTLSGVEYASVTSVKRKGFQTNARNARITHKMLDLRASHFIVPTCAADSGIKRHRAVHAPYDSQKSISAMPAMVWKKLIWNSRRFGIALRDLRLARKQNSIQNSETANDANK